MRVCFYHAEPEWSGRVRAFADAARALRDREHEVTFVCQHLSVVEHRLSAAGLDPIGIRARGASLAVGWRLSRVLRRGFIEAVFVHSEREQLQAAVAVRLADRGAVVRRMPPLGSLAFGREARFGSRIAATGLLFAFEADLRAARPLARALEPAVAPPGVAVGPSAPAARRDGGRRIVCFFGEESRGAAAGALRTLALLAERHPDMRLTLLGPGDPREALRIQSASLGVVSRVDTPRVDATAESDRATIAGADLGWVLGTGDDQLFATLDCFAVGVPVVAERNPLSARLVRDDETGVLTAALEPPDMAAVLASLCTDHARRERLSRGARTAAAAWPMDAMAAGFVRAAASARDRTRWRT